MKKQIIILILPIISLSSLSQDRFPTKEPCTKSLLLEVKGKWIKVADITPGGAVTQEIKNRMDAMQQLVYDMIPQPMGVDAVWCRKTGGGIGLFGYQVEFVRNNAGLNAMPVKGTSVVQYYFSAAFHNYLCSGSHEIMSDWKGETSAGITIAANSLSGCYYGLADNMTVDEREVHLRQPAKEKWKDGYELMTPYTGSDARYVLIHRKGILPYIPVTRKQYFDYTIPNLTKFYDEMIMAADKIPVRSMEEQEGEKNKVLAKYEKDYGANPKRLKSAVDYYLSGYQTDQQRRDEDKNKIIKLKNDVMKRYRDELEKTTKDGLLDSPAIILEMYQQYDYMPIFTTEAEGGAMLVTENPDYFRKDLPKNAAQILVLSWTWSASSPAQENVRKIIEANFPIEKLQAMIDK